MVNFPIQGDLVLRSSGCIPIRICLPRNKTNDKQFGTKSSNHSAAVTTRKQNVLNLFQFFMIFFPQISIEEVELRSISKFHGYLLRNKYLYTSLYIEIPTYVIIYEHQVTLPSTVSKYN